MISIIICSRNKELSEELKLNLAETLDVPYEVVLINNSENKYSIFSAYNLGAKKSKFDILCFMHEDIIFKSKGWGSIVEEFLSNPLVGVIGVAGAAVKTKSPSPWWIANGYKEDDLLCYNIIQKGEQGWYHEKSNFAANFIEVVILDGVWLRCKREVWEKVRFDETSFRGFHFYDLDFCMRSIELGYKNFVTSRITIKHYSTGSTTADWIVAADIFHKKWMHTLPVMTQAVDQAVLPELEYQAKKSFLWLLIKNRYGSTYRKLRIWFYLSLQKKPNKDNWQQLYSMFKFPNRVS